MKKNKNWKFEVGISLVITSILLVSSVSLVNGTDSNFDDEIILDEADDYEGYAFSNVIQRNNKQNEPLKNFVTAGVITSNSDKTKVDEVNDVYESVEHKDDGCDCGNQFVADDFDEVIEIGSYSSIDGLEVSSESDIGEQTFQRDADFDEARIIRYSGSRVFVRDDKKIKDKTQPVETGDKTDLDPIYYLPFQDITKFFLFDRDELDQYNDQDPYVALMIDDDPYGAQSFKPTLEVLTRVELYCEDWGSNGNVIVSIRSSLSGSDLTSVSVPIDDLPYPMDWYEFDFPDISVTPESTYYIVMKFPSGNGHVEWWMPDGEYYTRGDAWSWSSVYGWRKIKDYAGFYDFLFKTYGYTPMPDLTVIDIWTVPSTFCPDTYVDLYCNIKNIGGADVDDPFYVDMWFDDDWIGAAYWPYGLAAGDDEDFYYEDYLWPSDYDNHKVEVYVDWDDFIDESNENNNDREEQFSSGKPSISLTPSSYNFGDELVGDCTSEKTFTLTNTGPCSGSGTVSLIGTHSNQYVITYGGGSFTLNAGQSKSIKVKFCPLSTGYKYATLKADGTPPCNDDSSSLSGRGCEPNIVLTPANYDFGTVYVGDCSPVKTFTLTNTGCWPASGDVYSTDSNQFPITQGGGYFYLNGGASKQISVKFCPASQGSKIAYLKADGDNPCNDDESILNGYGDVEDPNIILTPESHDFGDVYVNECSTNYSFTLKNDGGQEATGTVYLEGTNSDQFQITEGGGSFQLDPDEVKTIKVRFCPDSPGSMTAILKADGNDPCNDDTSQLYGTSLSNPPSPPDIDGPAFGYIDQNIDFTLVTTDPDSGDTVYYWIEWGDGTNSGWLGSYPSGTTVEVSHNWSLNGNFTVKAKAKDNHGAESAWSNYHYVTIYDVTQIPHYAVVIGEWDYPGSGEDIPESYYNALGIFTCINNTNEWQRQNINYSSNRGATGIETDLNWMEDHEDIESISLFYYSGHGKQVDDDDGDEEDGKDEALYCSDGSYIIDDDLNDTLNLFDGPIVIILESCNSGGMPTFWEGNGYDDGLLGELRGNNRVLIAACNETQDSYTGGGFLSLFTNFIVIGWQGDADANGDYEITAEETFNYSAQKLALWIQNHGNPFVQTPQLFDGYDGKIPIIVSGFSPDNIPPDEPYNPSPSNGAENVTLSTDLSCVVTDPDNDLVSVGFYFEDGDDDILIGLDIDVTNGSTASINVTGLNPMTLYEWYVIVIDGINYTTSPTWQFTTKSSDMTSADITFLIGWNLITIPVDNNYNASTLAENITGCELISRFDAENQMFASYIVGGPPGFDFPIINGHGYFVLVNESSTLHVIGDSISSVSVPLYVGWNSIGWYHAYDTMASSLGENITGCEIVSRFNATDQEFKSYIVGGPPGFDFLITQSMGLFVLVDEASTWQGEG